MREEDRKTNEALKFSDTVSQHSNNINKSILMDIIIVHTMIDSIYMHKKSKIQENSH